MMRLLAGLLLLVPLLTMASDPDYNEGANVGKANASQGTNSLQNPGVVTGAIPGYTSAPPESGYYGGVKGGDGGIANQGQNQIGNSPAGSAIITSGSENPPVKIDPSAPYITSGKSDEGSAGSVVNGTNPECSATTVSKSTFQDYTCDMDVNTVQTCGRTASIQVTGSKGPYATQLVLNATDSTPIQLPSNWIKYEFTVPEDGTISSGTLEYRWTDYPNGRDTGPPLTFTSSFGVTKSLNGNSSVTFAIPTQQVTKGQIVYFQWYFDPTIPGVHLGSVARVSSGQDIMRITFPMTVIRDNTSSQVVWTESCGFDKSTAIASVGSVCDDPGGTRTVTVNGEQYSQTSDCWGYSDQYIVGSNSTGNCGTLMTNPNCTVAQKTCTQTENGICLHQSETYQCQTIEESQGVLCGGDYLCKSGDCDGTNGAGDSGFNAAVAELAGLAAAGDDVKNAQNQVNVTAFTGNAVSCREAFAGFSNCCKDSGWGQDSGLASCNSDEMSLGKAKEKKLTVSIGERCDHKVLGVCLQKSQVYCVFGGKLARIIQEQGRRDQLGVGFGSADSPNCSGVTIPQLQSINFKLINFSDFYSDLMTNQQIPNSDAMVQQVKDRIAAQVNSQTGGK